MKRIASITLIIGLAACSGKAADDTAQPLAKGPDSLVPIGDVQKLPPPTTTSTTTTTTTVTTKPTPPAAKPPAKPPATSTTTTSTTTTPAPKGAASLAGGTMIQTTMIDSVHSRYNKVGDIVKARVGSDVMSSDGRVVIPAGSVIAMRITTIAQAESRGEKGPLEMTATTIEINGVSKSISASADAYEYKMEARGVQSGDVAKVGAGAVAGAIIGRVIGGNKKGTIVGGVAGGAVGAAVASNTANRDIIVRAGQSMTLKLGGTFTKP